MKTRIDVPENEVWKDVYYHPEPIITRAMHYNAEKSWQKQIPGCKIECIDEKIGYMSGLNMGIKIKIIYPEDWQEHYIEPLANIHTSFWDCMSAVIYNTYPFYNRNKNGTVNGKLKKLWELGGKIHSIVAEIYWNTSYNKYNPEQWVIMLNNILAFIENNKIDSEDRLNWIKENLEKITQ
jgi:hypothetical protein